VTGNPPRSVRRLAWYFEAHSWPWQFGFVYEWPLCFIFAVGPWSFGIEQNEPTRDYEDVRRDVFDG